MRWEGPGFPASLCAHRGGGPALMPLPTTCHSQIQAQLDKLGTRKEEVSDKWDPPLGSGCSRVSVGPDTGLKGHKDIPPQHVRKCPEGDRVMLAYPRIPSSKHEAWAGVDRGLPWH